MGHFVSKITESLTVIIPLFAALILAYFLLRKSFVMFIEQLRQPSDQRAENYEKAATSQKFLLATRDDEIAELKRRTDTLEAAVRNKDALIALLQKQVNNVSSITLRQDGDHNETNEQLAELRRMFEQFTSGGIR